MDNSTVSRIHLGWLNLADAGSGAYGFERTQKLEFGGESKSAVVVRLMVDDGHWGLLLEAGRFDGIQELSNSSIRFATKVLEVAGVERALLHIQCLNSELNIVFMFFVADVIDSLVEGKKAVEAAIASFERFRELLRRQRDESISSEIELGVLGELLVLRELIQHNLAAVKFWLGPTGGRHDFRSSSGSLEVKATLNRDLDEIKISSIDQLESVEGTPLHLVVFVLIENSNGLNVPDLISEIRPIIPDRLQFDKLLASLGCDPQLTSLRSWRSFNVLSQRIYRVASNFPCLTRATFGEGGLPPGVRGVKYSIDLSHAEDFRMDGEEGEQVFSDLVQGVHG